MRKLLFAGIFTALLPLGAFAQTTQELVDGAKNTSNVLNYGMGYDLKRFSTLTQINRQTVKRLVPVWNYSYDDNKAEESQPLVYDGVLYVSTNSATMAIEAATGKQIWKTKIEYPPEIPRVVCCGIINRGVALFEGMVFRTTLDANVIALDARTGKEVWKSNVADFKAGYSETGAPLIADGVLITGISGAEFGIRGFIDGWDPSTGKHLWRTYTIAGPDDPNGKTWPGETWKRGGGSTWITGSYDPDLDLVYWGVGNPAPFNPIVRAGDNLYTDSVLALDPKTGKIKWHFQFTPNDPFDYDAVAEMILTTLNVGDNPTKVIMDVNRNGFLYVLDRADGHLIAANEYGHQTWAKGIDAETGRPILSEVGERVRRGEAVDVWPSMIGAKNWSPASYNPANGLVFANTINIGAHYKAVDVPFREGLQWTSAELSFIYPENDGPRGYLKAIDPLTGKARWQVPSDVPRFSGVLSTAGGLVFTGRMTGEFEAFDADSGEKLWQFKTGSSIEGQPITWQQDGVQYVAVSSGIGGVYSLYFGDERLAAVPAGGSLWVFALMQ